MSTPRSPRRIRVDAIIACCALILLAPTAAFALKTDRDQPLDVTANHFETHQTSRLTVLTGAVRLSQGSIRGEADKGTLSQTEGSEIQRVVLEGKPARLSQQLDNDGGMMHARATSIDYDTATSTAVLTGDAQVIQEGRGEFRGDRIVYNIESGEVTGGSNSPNSRVHLVVQPKKKDAAASAQGKN